MRQRVSKPLREQTQVGGRRTQGRRERTIACPAGTVARRAILHEDRFALGRLIRRRRAANQAQQRKNAEREYYPLSKMHHHRLRYFLVINGAGAFRSLTGGAAAPRSANLPVVRGFAALRPVNLDLHLLGSPFFGQRGSEFQHAVLVGRLQILGLHSLRQLDGSLECSVAGLAPIVLRMPGLLLLLARTLDSQESSDHPDIDASRTDAGRSTRMVSRSPSTNDSSAGRSG